MKTIGITAIILGVFLCVYQIQTQIRASYRLEKYYTNLWELADKSSTISAKYQYLLQFSSALQLGYNRGEFASHDAIWLQTPNNSFESNLKALTSLVERLAEIREMNPSSFEYNTAIQQITAQEQGEAGKIMAIFRGCYELASYPAIWGWIGFLLLLFECVLVSGGFLILEF